jgi:2-haloacid dehalogenase
VPEHRDGRVIEERPASPVVVFDLGGVLIDWDPRYVFRDLFDDEEAMERFLATVTTPAWNAGMDAGRSWADGVASLVVEHPAHRDLIETYRDRWPDMLNGAFDANVELLDELRAAGTRLYALSDWSVETFPVARRRFPFLDWFEGIVLSAEVGATKPDRRMFDELRVRYGVEPAGTVFIDDRAPNVEAAAALGFTAIHYLDPASLRGALARAGLDVHPAPGSSA